MSTIDVTNPGLVNVVTQGDGRLSVDQAVTVSVTSSAGGGISVVASSVTGAVHDITRTNPNDSNAVTEVFGLGLAKNVNIP